MRIQIIPYSSSLKYLGKQITFAQSTGGEITHRINTAWRKFMSLKSELTSKQYSLNTRLKLFSSVVSATMLYGCAAWTLTNKLENLIRRTERRMLRMILGSGRRPINRGDDSRDVEPWEEWIRRTTHQAERRVAELNLDDWLTVHRRQKLEWARQLVTDDVDTWAFRALAWQPDEVKYQRAQARPRRRWQDEICSLLRQHDVQMPWHEALRNDDIWNRIVLSSKMI
jgi:hypothetical protein